MEKTKEKEKEKEKETETTTSTTHEKGSFIKMITGRLVSLIAIEIDKPETQTLVRKKIIIPVINLIYSQLYPYIIILVAIITLILILSFLTFMFFLVFYFKTK